GSSDVCSSDLDHRQQLGYGARREKAPFESRVIGKLPGVSSQDLGRIGGGIATDRHEPHPMRQLVVAGNATAKPGHGLMHERASQRMRAIGIEEREQRDLAV